MKCASASPRPASTIPDALIVQKKYQVQPPLPFTPGTEVAGTVDKVGEGVKHVRAGDRVIAFVGIGGFAEYACAPAALVAPIPPGVSDTVAAAFTLTYATSHHALFDRGQLKSGETLLVLGAGGGVGLAAVELGKVAGARVLAAASSGEKLQAAHEHGADVLIDYSRQDLREAVKDATDGKGVDVVVRPGRRSAHGGGRALAGVARAPARDRLRAGRDPADSRQPAADQGHVGRRRVLGRLRATRAKGQRRDADGTVRLARRRRLRPHVSKTFALQEVPAALRSLLDRQAVGKLVVVP